MTTKYHFVALSKITMEDDGGRSLLKSNDIKLLTSDNLESAKYMDSGGFPNENAMKPLSQALVIGIITNIRNGAKRGWWKEGDHMRWVFDELQKAFVHITDDPINSELDLL